MSNYPSKPNLTLQTGFYCQTLKIQCKFPLSTFIVKIFVEIISFDLIAYGSCIKVTTQIVFQEMAKSVKKSF